MSFREQVKQLAARMVNLLYPANRNRIVVLCYHSIHPHKKYVNTTPELFQKHVQWLKDNCMLVTFGQFINLYRHGAPSKPVVSITLDDGYLDNYKYALPILSKLQVPATFFVTVGLIEQETSVIQHFLQGLRWRRTLEDIVPMSWSHLKEIISAGMEIGAHSYSHINLLQLSQEQLWKEVVLPKAIIGQRLGIEVVSMAYPFGYFNTDIVKKVREAGYCGAATVGHRGVRLSDDPYLIPRFVITSTDLHVFMAKVRGSLDMLAGLQRGNLCKAK